MAFFGDFISVSTLISTSTLTTSTTTNPHRRSDYNTQDAVLSLFWIEGLDRDRSASRRFVRMDIVTSTCKEEMSIWNWLTLATRCNKFTSIHQHIQSPSRRAGSDYERKQTTKERCPSLLFESIGQEPSLDRCRRRRRYSK